MEQEAIVEVIKNANRKLELQAYWMEYEYELKEHGFSGEEDYILKLTDMLFEEMFQINPKRILEKLVGTGAGSGMTCMFLGIGTLGFIISCVSYKNKDIQALNEIE